VSRTSDTDGQMNDTCKQWFQNLKEETFLKFQRGRLDIISLFRRRNIQTSCELDRAGSGREGVTDICDNSEETSGFITTANIFTGWTAVSLSEKVLKRGIRWSPKHLIA